jgi:hypothetical protein
MDVNFNLGPSIKQRLKLVKADYTGTWLFSYNRSNIYQVLS